MKENFYTFLWIILGLFSLVGLGGWFEIFPSLEYEVDEFFMIFVLFPLNFILCHFISYHIFKKIHFGLARFNYILFMIPTAIAVLLIELVITFFLFDYFLDWYDNGISGFFMPFLFFITCLIVFVYGGFGQLLQLALRAGKDANEDFFDGLKANIVNNAVKRAQQNKKKK